MSAMTRGLLVALLHVAIVASLSGKYLYDRETRPRVWVKTAPVDPDLPLRGRYVRLNVNVDDSQVKGEKYWFPGELAVINGKLVAQRKDDGSIRFWRDEREGSVRLHQTLAFFIPEHVPDPSVLRPSEELWVEVTVPRRGPPRPIQLARKSEGKWTPLGLQ